MKIEYIATTLLFALKTLTGLDDFEVHELHQILHFYSVSLKFIVTTSYKDILPQAQASGPFETTSSSSQQDGSYHGDLFHDTSCFPISIMADRLRCVIRCFLYPKRVIILQEYESVVKSK